MARPIRLDSHMKMGILKAVAQQLDATRMTHSGIKIEKKFLLDGEHKCTVCYTQKAWFKTIMLIETQQDEVGWYGLCYRDKEDSTVFRVEDIFVYPQKVTGTTVTPDAAEEAAWLNEFDDETFNHLRCHVHSHVTMGVTPSAVDQKFRDDRLSQLRDDDFMVFQIMNKRGEISSAVYDFAENIFYETEDVSTVVECESMEIWKTYKEIGKLLKGCNPEDIQPAVDLFVDAGVGAFLEEADEAVTKEIKPATGYYGGSGNYWNGMNGYRDYRNGYYNGSWKGNAGGITEVKSAGNTASGTVADVSQPEADDVDDDDAKADSVAYIGEVYDEARADAESYIREMYGDEFFDEYGEEMMNDPFFCSSK